MARGRDGFAVGVYQADSRDALQRGRLSIPARARQSLLSYACAKRPPALQRCSAGPDCQCATDRLDRVPVRVAAIALFCGSARPKTAWRLTLQAHGDHTTGLSGRWSAGPIYCTEITRQLIVSEIGVAPQLVRAVPLEREFTLHGVRIVAVDANHCPGACFFLFDIPSRQCNLGARRILHVGDFRYSSELYARHPLLRDVHTIFLDTTYARPRWNFPSQVCATVAAHRRPRRAATAPRRAARGALPHSPRSARRRKQSR